MKDAACMTNQGLHISFSNYVRRRDVYHHTNETCHIASMRAELIKRGFKNNVLAIENKWKNADRLCTPYTELLPKTKVEEKEPFEIKVIPKFQITVNGHDIPNGIQTFKKAKERLTKELSRYSENSWGRITYKQNGVIRQWQVTTKGENA